MRNKNLEKYRELDKNFFSGRIHWTYTWNNGVCDECIEWDDDLNLYSYYSYSEKKEYKFKDVYEAFNNIKINGKTITYLLIHTDFNIDSIN